jgi:hypothetical protein
MSDAASGPRPGPYSATVGPLHLVDCPRAPLSVVDNPDEVGPAIGQAEVASHRPDRRRGAIALVPALGPRGAAGGAVGVPRGKLTPEGRPS